MFGVLPAYEFFIRHVKGIAMRDVEVSHMKDDARPPFMLTDLAGADFIHVRGQRAQDVPTCDEEGRELQPSTELAAF